uniref:Solute carrier family 35 member F6 n=1 Tax=Sus scrofa TaxID=9823 RepID=A0A8D1G1C5_PIG
MMLLSALNPASVSAGSGHVPGGVLLPGRLLPAPVQGCGPPRHQRGSPAALQPPSFPAPSPLRHDRDQHHVCGYVARPGCEGLSETWDPGGAAEERATPPTPSYPAPLPHTLNPGLLSARCVISLEGTDRLGPQELMASTSLLLLALNMTSASSFQMLRGAVIIFTGLFSVAFLGRRLVLSQWLGILATIAGLVVVGLADLLSKHDSQHKLSEVITGDLLIIMAQIIVSIQMVLEEKFVYKHNVHPLRAVGTEGLFGFVILSLLLVPMYYIPAGSFSGNPRGTLEDVLDAFCQVGRQPLIALALLGNISSIAFFNFAGISVTKELSATTRMVLDSLRTIVIWALSLALGWEAFHPLQILGFLILLTGTALYNGLHRPLLARLSRGRPLAEEGEHERLLGGSRTAINDAS